MIIQLLPTISYGDAVSNDVIALRGAIEKLGYKTDIYADTSDKRIPKNLVKPVSKLPKLGKNDVVIYHMAIGAELNYTFGNLDCKKVMVYHNITPPEFFENYNLGATNLTKEGYKAVKWLADKVDYCIADSEYNKNDLIKMGYKCDIDVLPIMIPFDDYRKQPDEEVIKKYKDGYTNILFTGRIAPNKCQEDIIRSFAYYKKYYNKKSRLILVGSEGVFTNYKERLMKYIDMLDLKDVIFSGHIKFSEILAFYNISDIFLCQSEHEGFCVPIVEAMFFGIPIVAYNSSAIGDTMGIGGILLNEKNALETAGVMDYVVNNGEIRKRISENQKIKLLDYDYEVIFKKFEQILNKILA